jgi:hypothetical protein
MLATESSVLKLIMNWFIEVRYFWWGLFFIVKLVELSDCFLNRRYAQLSPVEILTRFIRLQNNK